MLCGYYNSKALLRKVCILAKKEDKKLAIVTNRPAKMLHDKRGKGQKHCITKTAP